MLASGVKLSKLNTNDLNSAGLVCLHCYSRACNACSNQCARLEKYVVLLCRSPNRYLYSADCFSQCAILYILKKKKKDINIFTTANSVEELVSSFGAE